MDGQFQRRGPADRGGRADLVRRLGQWRPLRAQSEPGATSFSVNLGGFEHFSTPSAAGGTTIPGCAAVAVSTTTGQAACTTTYVVAGTHAVTAAYSGDAGFAASSGSLTEVVVATKPVITHLKASAVRRRPRLTMSISLAARLTVIVYKEVPGRRVRHSCRLGAKHGRACRVALRKATLTLIARRGRNSFKPRMRALAPGHYLITVSADARRGRSKRYTATLVVRAR